METNHRIQEALMTVKEIVIFWKEAKCNNKRNINVYYAIVVSKPVYGLESLQMTKKQMEEIGTGLYE